MLVVSSTPGLTAKWLVPRLYKFLALHPEIETRITASVGYANFATDDIDVGIRLSSGVHPDLYVEKLSDEWLLPLCSPRLLEGEHPLRSGARPQAFHAHPGGPAGRGADLDRLDGDGGPRRHRQHARAAPQRGRPRARCRQRRRRRGAGLQDGCRARHRAQAAGRSVRAGNPAAGPGLLFRLRQGPGEARAHQGVSRLDVQRDAGDACGPAGGAGGCRSARLAAIGAR